MCVASTLARAQRVWGGAGDDFHRFYAAIAGIAAPGRSHTFGSALALGLSVAADFIGAASGARGLAAKFAGKFRQEAIHGDGLAAKKRLQLRVDRAAFSGGVVAL